MAEIKVKVWKCEVHGETEEPLMMGKEPYCNDAECMNKLKFLGQRLPQTELDARVRAATSKLRENARNHSPEWLTCDGEMPADAVKDRMNKLGTQRAALIADWEKYARRPLLVCDIFPNRADDKRRFKDTKPHEFV